MGLLEQILSNQERMLAVLEAIAKNGGTATTSGDAGKTSDKSAEKTTGKNTEKSAGKSSSKGKKDVEEATKPKHTMQEMVALLSEVSDKKGKTVAKEIINEVGGVAKMKEIPAEKYDEVVEAAEAALNDDAGDAGEDDDL